MKPYILLIILFSFSIQIIAQQQTRLYDIPAYSVATGKKAGAHKRTMERFLKNNKIRPAALESLAWLEMEEKKKRKLKAKEKVVEVLPKALEESEAQATTLQEGTQSFKDESTVTQLAQLKALYLELEKIREAHQALPVEWQISGLSFPDNYSNEIEQADQNLQKGREQAAEMLYQKARDLQHSKPDLMRSDYVQIARTLRRISQYATDYKDVATIYPGIKENAMIYLAIPHIQNKSQYQAAHTNYSRELLYGAINKKAGSKGYHYFELLPEDQSKNQKANLRLEASFSRPSNTKEYEEPTTKEKKKTGEGEGDKDVVYKGTMTTYSKRVYVHLTVTYQLKDLQTGKVLSSDTMEFKEHGWNTYWYTYSGDKRALSKSDKRSLETYDKEEPWPSVNDLVQMSFNSSKVADALAQIIIDYADKNGR